MSLVNDFLSLKCAGDILNVCSPINNPEKEITEAMAVVKRIRPIVLSEPNKYSVVDMAAGNGLVGVITAFLLPVREVVAVDILPRVRKWETVRKFSYRLSRVQDFTPPTGPWILAACHPCGDVAARVIDKYFMSSQCRHLILMPCCCGTPPNKIPAAITGKLGKYLSWAYSLSVYANGDLVIDNRCLSPCNAVIIASKNKGDTD